MAKPLVLIGQLGTMLDKGTYPQRWDNWRPSVDLFRHEDLTIDRFELLAGKRFHKLADQVRADIESISPETTVVIHDVEARDPWDFADVYGALRSFVDGYTFDEEREDYLAHITTGTHVSQICMFLLTETRHLPARLIQSSPQRKERSAVGKYSIIDLDLSRYDALAARFEEERRTGVSFLKAGIDTRNPAFNALMDRIEEVSLASNAPILLTGPTGVGKTKLARRVHELKRRGTHVTGEFVEINCATLRGDSAMSALFGHEKGAFTGALNSRGGLLLAANKGLLFLDEIGELGLDEQAMLLRAIEDGVFQPLGSDQTVSSSFQLIAGTNRDLAECVREGRFREDLLARIDLWSFELPSLRDRLEDIEPNLEFELERLSREFGRVLRFNKESHARFLKFATASDTAWRANFRDFGAAVTRMGTLAGGGRITSAIVDEEVLRLRTHWSRMAGDKPGDGIVEEVLGDEAAELDLFDRVQLEEVLRVCRKSRSLSDAGRALFAVSRTRKTTSNDATRLAKYLAKFGLKWPMSAFAPLD